MKLFFETAFDHSSGVGGDNATVEIDLDSFELEDIEYAKKTLADAFADIWDSIVRVSEVED